MGITVVVAPVSTSTNLVLLIAGGGANWPASRLISFVLSPWWSPLLWQRMKFSWRFSFSVRPQHAEMLLFQKYPRQQRRAQQLFSCEAFTFGGVTLKNSKTRLVRDPFSSFVTSLYSFGDTTPRMKSSCYSTFLFFNTEIEQRQNRSSTR